MTRRDIKPLTKPVPVPYTGPPTNNQLQALRHLTAIADIQGFGIATAPAIPTDTKSDIPALASIPQNGQAALRKPFRLQRVPWLLVILTAQAALSLRLVWSNTAFQDEALYLWAGHLEWQHWLHGAPISPAALPTYFSGAPVVYPPLGALADSIGGLPAARLLSLMFMLLATNLLYKVACQLFDNRTALFAAAVFVGTASSQFLGAFATYDAMALFLLALATWLGVRAAVSATALSLVTITSAGAVMAIADSAKYAAALFDPVVLGITALTMWRFRGPRRALMSFMLMACVSILVLGVGVKLGGEAYWHGITETTLTRSAGTTPALGVLFISAKWIGAVTFLAICGAFATQWSRQWHTKLLGCLLAGAVFLAPVEQARIHLLTSLFKHVGYGGWFAAIMAGYALAGLSRVVPPVKAAAAGRVALAVTVLSSLSGIAYAGTHFAVWPNTSAYVAELQPLLASVKGQVLIDTAQIPEYYLHRYVGYDRITNTSYFEYTDQITRKRITQPAAAYADAIRQRFFAVISLTYGSSPTIYDPRILSDIRKYGGYKLVSSIPFRTSSDAGHFLTWVRTGSPQ